MGSYSNPTLAEIKVTGLLSRSYGETINWVGTDFDWRGQPAGSWDAGGQFTPSANQCYGNVWVTFTQAGGKIFCDYVNASPTSLWADTMVVQGTGAARWYKGPLSYISVCDGANPPCYTYTGSHEVTVTPFEMKLQLKPNRYVVTTNTSVTFTASGTPTAVGGHTMPFSVQGWKWIPDTGTAVSVCSPSSTNPATCSRTLTSSGKMQVAALVNGVLDSTTVHIRVICDTTGIPELDSLPGLDLLKGLWDAGWDPDKDDRRERSGRMNCDANGICTNDMDTPTGNETPCKASIDIGDSTTVLYGHNHPVDSTEVPPAACLTSAQLDSGSSHYRTVAGPHNTDYAAARNLPAGRKFCVIDTFNIYCIPTGIPIDQPLPLPDRYPRVMACGRLVLRGKFYGGPHLYASEGHIYKEQGQCALS